MDCSDYGSDAACISCDRYPRRRSYVPAVLEVTLVAHNAEHSHGNHHSATYVESLGRLYSLIKADRGDILVIAIFAVVTGVLSLATPLAVEALVNSVAFGRYLLPVVVLSIVLFTFLAFGSLLRGLQIFVAEILQRRLFVRVVGQLLDLLPRVRSDAYDHRHGPELLNRFFEVITLQKTVASLTLDGVTILIQALIGMIVLASYHPWLLGFDIVLLAVMSFTVFVLGTGGLRTSIEESAAKYEVAAWLQQMAGMTVATKRQSGVNYCLRRGDDLTVRYLEGRRRHFSVLLRQISFALLTQAVAGTTLLGLGGWLVINGRLSLGQLVAAELIVTVIVGAFAKLGKHLESWFDLMTSVDKLGHLFELPVEPSVNETIPSSSNGLAVSLREPVYIHANHVRCPNAVEAMIKANECAAIVGPSACGKSTVMDMLFGLRAPSHGFIELDGIDIRSIDRGSLREQVELVRDSEVIPATILENLRLGKPDLQVADLRTALETVGLYDEVTRLPDGLESQLASHGPPLTRNQLIRLTLARAIANRPRLLLIDGALDQLPDETSKSILMAIRREYQGCTVVLASGRQDLIRLCDRILRLADTSETAEPDGAVTG
jgi:putative ABC transport system ATP-binding protein